MRINPTQVVFSFRPIDRWIGPEKPGNRNDQFRSKASQTQTDLRVELAFIGVREAVIQADVTEDDVRQDGMLRVNASFRSSRVALSFTHPTQGAMTFPCWTYRDPWANVRAIAKTLQSLRAVDRYGVTRNAQQYTGWRALPPGGTIVAAEFVSVEAAARFLMETAAVNFTDIDAESMIRRAEDRGVVYHAAARRAHPDQGGSEHLMRRVNLARDFIERHASPAGGLGS